MLRRWAQRRLPFPVWQYESTSSVLLLVFRRWAIMRGFQVDGYWRRDSHIPKWVVVRGCGQRFAARWLLALDLRRWHLKFWNMQITRTVYADRTWNGGWNLMVGPIHLQHRTEFDA